MEYMSIRFALLVCVTFIAYYTLGKVLPKKQWVVLLVGSLLFYASYDVCFLFFILFSILTSYGCGRYIHQTPEKSKKKGMLIACLVVNVLVLVYAKYFLSSLQWLHFENTFSVIVPLGIAYYTLQVVAYLVDVYRGKTEVETNVFRYALFISYFPIIVQGPIERKNALYRTLFTPHTFDYDKTCRALQLILWGLMKKMVVADRLNIMVQEIFQQADTLSGFILYAGIIMYTIQIYMDFSGCVDICRGVSRLFRVELSRNFDNPYFATSIRDFWRKWHISLSSWLKDYIYIPLGGNRKGTIMKCVFLIITFFVSGLWHGDGLKFIVWGLLHGVYQVIGVVLIPVRQKFYAITKIDEHEKSKRILSMVITFHLVAFAWIFFRSATYDDAILYIGNMFSEWNPWIFFDQTLTQFGQGLPEIVMLTVLIILIFVAEKNSRAKQTSLLMRVSKQTLIIRWSVYIGLIVIIFAFGIYGPGYDATQFIYGGF